MEVKVNNDACIGCGACTSICPNVFEMDDNGLSTVKVNPVPEEEKDNVNDAIGSCPTSAIEEV